MAVSVMFTNEKGNISVKVRNDLRKQVIEKVKTALENAGLPVEDNANGGLSFKIAEDRANNNADIFAHFDLTISTRDPSVKLEKRSNKKKADTAEEPIPSLFD